MLNGALLAGTVAVGYVSDRGRTSSRPDAWINIVFGILAILVSLRYAASRTQLFRPPSWKRVAPFFDWWDDPFQFYFELTLFCAGMAIGRALWASVIGHQSLFGWYVFLLVGLLAGEAIGYAVYRSRIKKI